MPAPWICQRCFRRLQFSSVQEMKESVNAWLDINLRTVLPCIFYCMLQEDIGNKCDINLQSAGECMSVISGVGAAGAAVAGKIVSCVWINSSGFIRK